MKKSASSLIAFATVILYAAFGAAQTDLSDEELLERQSVLFHLIEQAAELQDTRTHDRFGDFLVYCIRRELRNRAAQSGLADPLVDIILVYPVCCIGYRAQEPGSCRRICPARFDRFDV